MHDDTPEDDILDWSAPIETLARPVKPVADRSFRPMMMIAILLGVILGGWLWTLRPQPARASAATPPSRVEPASFDSTPRKRVDLFELPEWDDSKP